MIATRGFPTAFGFTKFVFGRGSAYSAPTDP